MSTMQTPEEMAAAQLQRAKALLDMGRHQQAIPVIADALRMNPDAVEPYCYLAFALRMGGQKQQALQVIEDALQRDPNNEWPHRLRSVTYQEMREYREALASAREAHRLNPDVWQTKFQLSDVLLNMGQFDEAELVSEALRTLAPDNVNGYNQLGRIALTRDRLLEAELHFREALRVDPTAAYVHENLGRTLTKQGRMREAVQFYDSALAADPTQRDAQANLYATARALRGQTLLATPKRLLARISPKVYQYYLQREEGSFRVLFFLYLAKFFLPVTALLAVTAWFVDRQLGYDNAEHWITADIGIGLLGLLAARRGPWRGYFDATPTQVQVISTFTPWLFSPLTLIAIGMLGAKFDEDDWVLYLVLIIIGIVFFAKLMVRRARGQYYGWVARAYPGMLKQRARIGRFLAQSPRGRIALTAWKIISSPLIFAAIGLLGLRFTDDRDLASLWLLLLIGGSSVATAKMLFPGKPGTKAVFRKFRP